MKQAVILAGGLGTRLRSVVTDVPKPMAPINGKPFLHHLMHYWIGQGIERFVLSIGYKASIISDYFKDRFEGAEVAYAVENEPLGTGGGLCLSVEFLKPAKQFVILNGDTFFEVDLKSLESFHSARQADLTLSLYSVPANARYGGVVVNEAGRLSSFEPTAQAKTGNVLINGGVYLAERALFDEYAGRPSAPLSLESGLFAKMLSSERKLFGLESRGRFIDIGIPEDYERAAGVL